MLEKSFVFLERIGALYEQRLWRQEICSWHDFLNAKEIRGLSKHRKAYCDRKLREAMHFFYGFDSSYFINKLPQNEMWRLYHSFSDETVFLDIETAGLSTANPVTVIGLFDGINTKTMIKGINLDEKSLAKELQKYKLIVTFNGASFDLPFLRRHFPGLLPRVPHFDLKPACARIGLKGGLKAIEKQLGIKRGRIVDGMYGGDALCLWKMYRATGDDYYLQLLVEYNEEDVVNLKTIANHVTEELSRQIKEKYFRKEEPSAL
jgi:uncharacterized protein YprB with RNaseH-like and TPR domain